MVKLAKPGDIQEKRSLNFKMNGASYHFVVVSKISIYNSVNYFSCLMELSLVMEMMDQALRA